MRYREKIKFSWGYHWGIFREIWDMFTVQGWCWLVLGLAVVLCVAPVIFAQIGYRVGYYLRTPIPVIDSRLPEDINFQLAIKDYHRQAGETPNIPVVINYYWVKSSNFKPLALVLCISSGFLLVVAWLREGEREGGQW